MVIYLVRHGETDWNRQGRFQGVEDIALNETGYMQARACARAFEGVPVDCVMTSPLKRARVTAEIIAGYLGVGSVLIESGLTERDFGRVSGLLPTERDELLASGEETGMEDFEALKKRLMTVVDACIHDCAAEHILMVSHGGSINAILAHVSHGAFGTGKTVLKNTCICRLDCENGEIGVGFYNVTPEEFKLLQQ